MHAKSSEGQDIMRLNRMIRLHIAAGEETTWHVCSVISGTGANVKNLEQPGTKDINGMTASVKMR